MFDKDSYTRKFTDMISEGFIFIDTEGKIQIYNNKAKEIFGITYNHGISHNSGKIENGDIVIIGDNCLGKDDGNLTPESLGLIGIKKDELEIGDAFIAIGIFDDKKQQERILKISKPHYDNRNLELNCRYFGIEFHGVIDFQSKNISLGFDEEIYNMSYINAIGHIVVLDGTTKKLKFYQTQGYTARREGINDLLMGKEYMAKGEDSEFLDVIGIDIFEIHRGGVTVEEFYGAATGKDISYVNEFKEINGRPTMCSLLPVDQGEKRVGAVLKVEDISEIKKVIRERDEALLNLEQMEIKLSKEGAMEILPEIIGESKEIANVKKLAFRASKTNSTVLLLGESGTGKSLLAKAIHNISKNKDKPFIHVNCGSIPENLLESELFGYERGAFTGARGDGKSGMFELAQGGTIFLDEIGEISLNLQVKLLQVLQNKTFFKIGGNKNIEVDVRIIVATNKNLESEMLKGRFREDLYYRINVFPIWIPPLRDRKQDVYSLVEHILPTICLRTGCDVKRISGEALSLLSSYQWPGNIRELENILERAVNLAEGNTILSTHLSISSLRSIEKEGKMVLKSLKDFINEAEKKAISEALFLSGGDKKAAMKLLNVGKTSFYEKIKKYNLE